MDTVIFQLSTIAQILVSHAELQGLKDIGRDVTELSDAAEQLRALLKSSVFASSPALATNAGRHALEVSYEPCARFSYWSWHVICGLAASEFCPP